MEKIEINKTNNVDCVEGLRKIKSGVIDFILTDPPFNFGIDYHGFSINLQNEEYYKWCLEWMKELYRVLKPGRCAAIFF